MMSVTALFLPAGVWAKWLCAYPFQLLNTGIIDMDYLQGTFSERQELDSYEQMWHTYIYQPAWSELKTEVSNTNMLVCTYA